MTDKAPAIPSFFNSLESLEAHCMFLGHRLNLKKYRNANRIALTPLTVQIGKEGYAVLFRYGVIVFFNVDAAARQDFAARITAYVSTPLTPPIEDMETIVINKDRPEGSYPRYIALDEWTIPKLQLIADILGKSIILSYFEERMSELFDKLETVTSAMTTGKISSTGSRQLVNHVGMTLSIQRLMTGHVEIDDKPEMLWEMSELESFYIHLQDDFEIVERYEALEKKLDLIYKTSETLLGMLHERKSLRVEWYIVILIIFDIALHLAEKYMGI